MIPQTQTTNADGNAVFAQVPGGIHQAIATKDTVSGSANITVNQDGQIFTVILGVTGPPPPPSNWKLIAAVVGIAGAAAAGLAYSLRKKGKKFT